MGVEKTLRLFDPLNPEFRLFQKYYLYGFGTNPKIERLKCYPSRVSIPDDFVGMDRNRYSRFVNYSLNALLRRLPEARSEEVRLAYHRHHKRVGQYTLHEPDGRTLRFAVDSGDEGWVLSPEILDWCDLYFKSNRWRTLSYPDKVLPIVNGNGYIVSGHGEPINRLRSLRDSEKHWDLVFVTRIYEPGPTHNMEHNVRLFEALARSDCKKYLMAIFTREALATDKRAAGAFEDRLTKAGVHVVHKRLMPLDRLYRLQAASRLVVLRAGPLRCIPWRMVELLCAGTCIVCDALPDPEWPVPLRDGENFINLGVHRSEDAAEGSPEDYERVPLIIEKALKDQELQGRVRKNNAEYFDNHASPGKVAEYALSELDKLAAARRREN